MPTWAAITQYHRLECLKQHSFLTAIEAGKSKVKVPADLVPGS